MSYEIVVPEIEQQLDQDEEWIIVKSGARQEKMRLHDYDEIYKHPGLYEQIFCQKLRCDSPKVICNLLEETKGDLEDCRVLDFGAGNGMVGEEIIQKGGDLIVGVDIIKEAREAAQRDHADAYEDYYVIDMAELGEEETKELRQYHFNTLISVAALGFEDIPPKAFLNAFNLVRKEGWIAFNIKDRFLTNQDDTGYKDIIDEISDDNLTILRQKRYRHRLSLDGKELYYIAIIGRKKADVNLNEVDI